MTRGGMVTVIILNVGIEEETLRSSYIHTLQCGHWRWTTGIIQMDAWRVDDDDNLEYYKSFYALKTRENRSDTIMLKHDQVCLGRHRAREQKENGCHEL